MSRVCELCGKSTTTGRTIKRRGLAKAKGGVGRKIVGRTKRRFKPNVQKVKAIVDGSVRRLRVCTACIRAGAVTKAP